MFQVKKLLFLLSILFVSNFCWGQFGTNYKPVSNGSYNPGNVSDITSIDFDFDGDSDLLVIDDKISLYENLGEGLFDYHSTIDNGSNGEAIHVADLDNDLLPDVIAAWRSEDKIVWYKNLGSGNFSSEYLISDTLMDVRSMICGDFDNDGMLDVAYACEQPFSIGWHKNLGAGIFGVEQELEVFSNVIVCLDTLDSDADNDLDIVASSSTGHEVFFIENIGAGIFSNSVLIESGFLSANGIGTADLNGDNNPDIYVKSNTALKWYQNLGSNTFSSGILVSDSLVGSFRSHAVDVDFDGDLDLVSSDYNSDLTVWFENDGFGNLSSEKTLSQFFMTRFFSINVDGNPNEELIMGGENSMLSWVDYLGSNNFTHPHFITSPGAMLSAHFGDMDNDGDLDVLSGGLLLGWFENVGNGNFGLQHTASSHAGNFYGVYAADLDGDNDLDILGAEENLDRIEWAENDGNGNFISNTVISTMSDNAYMVEAHDLDNDGDNDVIWCSVVNPLVVWQENLGNGIFGPENILSSTSPCTNFAVSDLDNDGDLDISFSHQNTDIKYCENLGNGNFGSEQVLTNQVNNVRWHCSADFNNDGLLDIASISTNDLEIEWFENLGGLSFGPSQLISTDVDFWYSANLHAADLDEDGDMDLVSCSDQDLKLAWYENLGGTFGSQQVLYVGVYGVSILPVDINDDNDVDLVAGIYSPYRIAYFENLLYHPVQLKGRVFIDFDQNGLNDSTDVGLEQVGIFSNPISDYTFTYSDGQYYLPFSDTLGVYEVFTDSLNYWTLTTDSSSYTVAVDSNNMVIDSLDFGFYPDTAVHNLDIELVGGYTTCDDTINYWISNENVGSALVSGIIHLELHDSLGFISSSIPPDSVIGQNMYWHFDSLFYFFTQLIDIEVSTPDFNSIGDTLGSSLNIYTIDTLGNTVFSDTDYFNPILTCAYDPNDKMSEPIGEGPLGFIDPLTSSVDYTIRFQNTGNDTAQTVVIKDVLDPNLDWTTLQPLASSDPVQTIVDLSGEVTFTFNDIMLPDSNINEPESHGFVRFRIDLLPNVPLGTSIYNNAEIYFDLNPAILTNTKILTLKCPATYGTVDTSAICQGDSLMIFGQYEYFTGTYTDTLTNVEGCDSLLSKELLVHFSGTIFQPVQNICFGDSLLIFNDYQSSSGFYYDTIQTIFGCDSVLGIELIVDPVVSNNFPQTDICQNDSTQIFGTYQSTAGLYYDTLQTTQGCDSIITQELIVNPLPTVTMDQLANDTLCEYASPYNLTATPAGGTFAGTGVSGNTFDPNTAGPGVHTLFYSYTDGNNCSATDSVIVTVDACLGIENKAFPNLTIYPNPFSDFTTISFGQELNGGHNIRIYDVLGKEVYARDHVSGIQIQIYKNQLGAGVYLFSIFDNVSGAEVYNTKLIVE